MSQGQFHDSTSQGGGNARRLRVLQVGKYYPPHHGGIETHLQLLCEGLQPHVDLDVVVASDDRETHHERIGATPLTRLGTAFHFAGAPICPGLVRRLASTPADVVHLHLPNPAAVLAYLASGHRGRLVLSYHSDVVRQKAMDLAFRPFMKLLLRRSDAVIAATPNYVASSPLLSRHRGSCHVIPYGIPLEPFRTPSPLAEDLRRRFGSRLIVSVGRLVYYKGFEPLIEAMQWVDGHLLIVGDGPLRGVLEERARSLGVADRVTIQGAVEEVAPYYQAAELFVLASVARSEAFGIVQLEAMACGRPVVNTGLDSGVPYVSLHEETGLTVAPGDPRALARAIGRLLDDDALRERLGRAARARVEREFSQSTMVERMLTLYHRVCAEPGKSAVVGPARPLPCSA